jgi:predicted MFS family arabinose efflux permease
MMVMGLAPSRSPAIGAYLIQWIGWRADFVCSASSVQRS